MKKAVLTFASTNSNIVFDSKKDLLKALNKLYGKKRSEKANRYNSKITLIIVNNKVVAEYMFNVRM